MLMLHFFVIVFCCNDGSYGCNVLKIEECSLFIYAVYVCSWMVRDWGYCAFLVDANFDDHLLFFSDGSHNYCVSPWGIFCEE